MLLFSLQIFALRVPAGPNIDRRAAVWVLPAAVLAPQAASATYRPSLAEFKGYGSSPVVDDSKDPTPIKTELSHAQLVANSVRQQEEMLGRALTESEVAAIEAKISKYYPGAK